MKKRSSLWILILFTLLILLAMGGWWFLRPEYPASDAPPEPPVFVFLLSPANGDEVEAGDYVSVMAQASSSETITSMDLFVDGQSLGTISDLSGDAAWTWQAWPVSIHTFYARAITVNGRIGYSQSISVNVLAGDGQMQVQAEEGQTLTEIGADFGASPIQMVDANPALDSDQPLEGGQPVQVPVGNGEAGDGSGPGDGSGNSNSVIVTWQFSTDQPVDKSYCYASSGDGIWDKIPSPPFEFITGAGNTYTQFFDVFSSQTMTFQMQCWGWLGGTLKYLGQGQSQMDVLQPPAELRIIGEGFTLVGIPNMPDIPIQPEDFTGGSTKTIPPPFALRQPEDAAECTAHGHPLLAPFICDTLMNAPLKQHTILVWEWQPKTNWPGNELWLNDIDGYRIYEFDPVTKTDKYLKTINDPNQKVTAVPLGWAGTCYGVQAFIDDPVLEPSLIAYYCPGQQETSQVLKLQPSKWLTTGGKWIQSGDCDTYGGLEYFTYFSQNYVVGKPAGRVLVGGYIVDDDDADCFRQGDYSGAVKFTTFQYLPANSVIQKAVLKFSSVYTDYGASGVATNFSEFCVSAVGRAKQDWAGLISGNNFYGKNVLMST
ncbi:MAG: Ig-like domain-containing protein, partial [Chloroflexi bacterium]|nr:Ig-like domain-containing protein [Chloroflexota bacterium]